MCVCMYLVTLQLFQLRFPEFDDKCAAASCHQSTQSVMSTEGSARTPLQVLPNAAVLRQAERTSDAKLPDSHGFRRLILETSA